MKLTQDLHTRNIRGDIFGGVTAAVVALPLALDFGVASGAGPIVGLYGAIAVGFFAALFGGTAMQISGPTGPMTVVMATIFSAYIAADPHTGLATAFGVVIIAGVFQILFGLCRLGKYFILVPYPVISGFMSGIGIIIIILQLGPLLGQDATGDVLGSLKQLPHSIGNANINAVILGLMSLSIATFWPKSLGKYLPGALAALIIGTLVFVIVMPSAGINVIGVISASSVSFDLPHFEIPLLKNMLRDGLLLATLGAIDSLLTSLVADSMTKTHHHSDRELVGQGIGNVVAGFVGGLPGAGATMRTMVNINAGGKTAVSGMVHAVVLLVIVLGAAPLAKNIPNAVLAGILIKVGLDIIDKGFLLRFFRLPHFTQALMIGVLLLTVFVDLITAVVVGIFIVNIVTISRLTHLQLDNLLITNGDDEDGAIGSAAEQELLRQAEGQIVLFHLHGPLSYGVARGVQGRLRAYTSHKILILDLTGASLVGITTSIAIEQIIIDAHETHKTVFLTGISLNARRSLMKLNIIDLVPSDFIFPFRRQAIEKASQLLSSSAPPTQQ